LFNIHNEQRKSFDLTSLKLSYMMLSLANKDN